LHVNALLEGRGWRVIRCWQHEVKKDLPGCINRIRAALSVRRKK
jgi:very-short-patch-repair endonuclease